MPVFKLNRRGIAELLVSPQMVAMVGAKAQKVLNQAVATAPYDASSPGPHYKDDFHVEVVIEPTGIGRDGQIPRAIGKVSNTNPKALDIEFGGGPPAANPPRHRTLGKALPAARG